MLMFPAVAALAATDLSASYGEVLKLATGSFIAFGVFSLPMGWLADRLSREFMMTVFFLGIGVAMILTGFSEAAIAAHSCFKRVFPEKVLHFEYYHH